MTTCLNESSGIRLTNMRKGRAGGAGSTGFVVTAARGSALRRAVVMTPMAAAAPIAVTTHAAIRIQRRATSLTVLSCHRRGAQVRSACGAGAVKWP
jgi:hypothetical protein